MPLFARRLTLKLGGLVHRGDRWKIARYAGYCRGCGGMVGVGDRVLHRRDAHAVWCGRCGGR